MFGGRITVDLSRVKQLMLHGVSFEKAYGFCMQQLAKSEDQIPSHKVQEARRRSAAFGAMRPSSGASDNPEIVKKIDMFLQNKVHQKDIAKVLKISQHTVSKIKKRHNLPTKKLDDE
jgi:DNA invertase Pin-like site-specific DNA recombinase